MPLSRRLCHRLCHRDALAGIFFLAVGLIVLGIATRYPLGTAGRMGPGYFPALLGGLLAVLGLLVALPALRPRHAVDGVRVALPALRPALLISSSLLLFAAAIQTAGLALTTFGVVAVSSTAHREFRWAELGLSALALSALAVGVFAYGLRLPFQVLPV